MANITGGSVVWNFDVDKSKFNAGLASASTEAKAFGNSLGKISFGKMVGNANSAFNSIADGIANLGKKVAIGAVAGAALGSVFVKSAADLQTTSKSMQVLIGNTDKANKLFSQLAVYANKTPFEFPDIARAGKTLLGFGINANDVFKDVQMLGDIAGVTGADFSSLAVVFGQVNATGRLMGQDALQLINNNIPITTILAKKLGISVQEVKKRMEEGALSSDLFNQALLDVTSQGGFAFKGAEQLAGTFSGRLSTLKDAVMNFGRELLGVKIDPKLGLVIEPGGIFDKLSGLLPKITDKLTELSPKFQAAFGWIIDHGSYIVAIAGAFVAAFAVAKIGGIITSILKLGAGMLFATGQIGAATAAQWGFNTAVYANPIGLIVAAVVALIGVLAFLQIKFNIIGKAIAAVSAVVKPFINIVKLLATGDFQGGIFGLQEDSPVIGFFLTLSKVIRAVAGFIGNQLKSSFESLLSIFKQIGGLLKPVVGIFKAIGNVLIEIGKNKTVQTVFKVIGIAMAAILAAPIVAFFATLVVGLKILATVLKFVADHFKGIAKIVGVAIAVAFLPLTVAIGLVIAAFKFLPGIIRTIGKVIGEVFNAIAAVWNSVLKPVFDVFAAILEAIGLVVLRIFAFIALIIIGTLTIIVTFIWNIMQRIWTIMSTVWNAIWGVINAVLGFIWNRIVNAFNFYLNIIKTVLGFIIGVVTTVWNAIYGVISAVLGRIWSVITSIWNRISGFIGGIVGAVWGRLKSGFENIYNGVTGILGRLVHFVGGIGGKIVSAIGNLGKTLYEKGKDLINGLINGAGSILSKIGEFFLNKVPGFIRGPFKKALGISSPSKVFGGYGKNIMQGLAQGVNNSTGLITGAMNNASDALSSGFSNLTGNELDINASASIADAQAAQVKTIAPVSVRVDMSGIVARSRSEWRDLGVDLIGAVNEDLRARRLPEIGGGAIG